MRKVKNHSRRGFIRAGVSVASLAVSGAGAAQGEKQKVLYVELLPQEFRARLKARPIAYLPLGTLEWHGEHLPLGSDAIQSEGLMIECARRFGGIVMPPIHLGPDRARPMEDGRVLYGMDYAASTKPPRQLDGSSYWVPAGLHVLLVDAILAQLRRAGFRAVFGDGHGPSRTSWVENLPERETRFGLKLFGVTKEISSQWRSQVDHAGRNETSLVMHYRPGLVDLSQLSRDRADQPVGVGGEDPRDATVAYGRKCMEESIELVRQLFQKSGLVS
jgi:creatinine amidohydrolase